MDNKILIGIIFLGLLVLSGCEKIVNVTAICETKCADFEWGIYRVEEIKTVGRTNYDCWCLKDGEPYSLGVIHTGLSGMKTK